MNMTVLEGWSVEEELHHNSGTKLYQHSAVCNRYPQPAGCRSPPLSHLRPTSEGDTVFGYAPRDTQAQIDGRQYTVLERVDPGGISTRVAMNWSLIRNAAYQVPHATMVPVQR